MFLFVSDRVVVTAEVRLHRLRNGWQVSVEVVAGEQTGWRVDAGHGVFDLRGL